MAERCATCRRSIVIGAEFDPMLHCPRGNGWPLGASVQDAVDCLRAGIASRDRTIATSKELLRQQNQALAAAIEAMGGEHG